MIKVRVENIQKDKIEPFFEQWESLRMQIHELHQARKKEAHPLMEKGIALYEQLISYTSGQTYIENEQYEAFPLNGLERLQFIKSRPSQFASFRQLDELFKETKKKIARLRVQYN